MKKVLIIIAAIFCLAQHSYSQDLKSNTPKFSGVVKLPSGVPSKGDTLTFGYKLPHVPEGSIQEVVRVVTDNDGRFNFGLPNFDVPIAFNMSIRHNGKYSRVHQVDRYFVENSDKIFMTIQLDKNDEFDSIAFSGIGSEKYNILTSCSKIYDRISGELMERFLDLERKLKFESPDNLESKFLQYTALADEMAKKQAKLINNAKLPPEMKKMIMFQRSALYFEWMFRMRVYYDFYQRQNDTASISIIKNIYEKNKERFIHPYKTDSLMVLCQNYVFDQAEREGWSLVFFDQKSNKIKEIDLYNIFKTKYDGALREMFIANFFIAGTGGYMQLRPKKMDSLMVDGQKYITTPIVKEMYDRKCKLLTGKEVFNGIFKDLNGNDVSIASLKGKVIFIDIWGWGCSACARFHQMFHRDVYPDFKNNKDFVYLSISADRTKELYQRSLDKKIYTSPDYLNVFMQDLGLRQHPFAKNYNIGSAPFLLVVDRNGRISTSKIGSNADQVKSIIKGTLSIPLDKSKI